MDHRLKLTLSIIQARQTAKWKVTHISKRQYYGAQKIMGFMQTTPLTRFNLARKRVHNVQPFSHRKMALRLERQIRLAAAERLTSEFDHLEICHWMIKFITYEDNYYSMPK